jgi:hypothetical protein
MSVKKEASGRRSVQIEFEVPGTPEEFWQAIAKRLFAEGTQHTHSSLSARPPRRSGVLLNTYKVAGLLSHELLGPCMDRSICRIAPT